MIAIMGTLSWPPKDSRCQNMPEGATADDLLQVA